MKQKKRIDINLGIRTGNLILKTIDKLVRERQKSEFCYNRSRWVREAIIEKIQRERN